MCSGWRKLGTLLEFRLASLLVMEENERAKEEEEEEVWSWGAGTEGQLGTGKLEDEHLPQQLLLAFPSLPSAGPISLLACGGAHVIALTASGRVLTWGRGTSGQLGHGEMVNSLQPKPVNVLESFVMTHVSAGWSHSGFVSDTGCLFTCGDGSFGQLGHGDYQSHCSPMKVLSFGSKHVVQIACGMRHSLVLLKGNSGDQVYGFGSGKRGQLGISKDKIKLISLPQVTLGFEDVEINTIGANGDHSVALSCESSNCLLNAMICQIINKDQQLGKDLLDGAQILLNLTDGHLYTWGRGFSGTSDTYCPQCLPSSLWLTQAALGWNHVLVLTGDGEVFMLGGNHHGVLSGPQKLGPEKRLLEDSREVVLEKVHGLDGLKVMQIAAGAEHSALVTEDGVVKTWGWGEHGQLGLGNTCDQTSPQTVNLGHKLPNKHATSKVYCGSGFTFVTRTVCLPSQM